MPESWRHGFAITNGIRLHYVEQGEGPLMILLHGFPEFWYRGRFCDHPEHEAAQLAARLRNESDRVCPFEKGPEIQLLAGSRIRSLTPEHWGVSLVFDPFRFG